MQRYFAGGSAERNTSEPETLQTMLKNLDGRAGRGSWSVILVSRYTGRCHSEERQKKERAMQDRFSERFEAALKSLAEGLKKKIASQ